MSDWIGLGVILALLVLALVGMSRLGSPRPEMTAEEFEERARRGEHAGRDVRAATALAPEGGQGRRGAAGFEGRLLQ
jgi:hypothetical protein